MSPKRLFIIAGPNGSGKSLFSKELTGSDFAVFDGDKCMSELSTKFPETGIEALWSYINDDIFHQEKIKAISSGIDYAFETNFSASDPMVSAREFQIADYELHLIFLGLNSLEESIQRVAYRVKTGGHKVAEESIRYNYEFGYKNLYKYFKDFNSVILFDNAIANTDKAVIPREILHIVNNVLYMQSVVVPQWAVLIINEFGSSGKLLSDI